MKVTEETKRLIADIKEMALRDKCLLYSHRGDSYMATSSQMKHSILPKSVIEYQRKNRSSYEEIEDLVYSILNDDSEIMSFWIGRSRFRQRDRFCNYILFTANEEIAKQYINEQAVKIYKEWHYKGTIKDALTLDEEIITIGNKKGNQFFNKYRESFIQEQEELVNNSNNDYYTILDMIKGIEPCGRKVKIYDPITDTDLIGQGVAFRVVSDIYSSIIVYCEETGKEYEVVACSKDSEKTAEFIRKYEKVSDKKWKSFVIENIKIYGLEFSIIKTLERRPRQFRGQFIYRRR